MPIIQERLKSILDATEEYERAVSWYQSALADLYSNIDLQEFTLQKQGQDLSPSEQQLKTTLSQLLQTQPISIKAVTVLVREREHYRLTSHRNKRTAARQRINRGAARPEDIDYAASMGRPYGPHKSHASYRPTNPHSPDPSAQPLDFNPSDPHPIPVPPRPRDLTETEFFVEPDPDAMTPEDAQELFKAPSGAFTKPD